MNKDLVIGFLKCFAPDEKLDNVGDSYFEKYNGVLPDEILAIWANFGFGNYGSGILKMVDPDLFQKNLNTWRREENDKYIPFMITAFGDMFYYKTIDGSVYLLSIIYRKEKKVANSFEEFLRDYITSAPAIRGDLRAALYSAAYDSENIGPLSNDDIYAFFPAVAQGGAETLESIQKADAYVYQDIAYGD